jgi:hypothetical protein
LIIEDGPRPSTAELETALAHGVSFGFHDDGPSGGEWSNYHDGFQWVPVAWTMDTSAKQAFFGSISRLTKTAADAADPELVVSPFSDRSGPLPLDGETLTGAAYIFVAGAVGVTTTRFWLDDADRSGPPANVEDDAPWDFAGGDVTAARPLDTGALGAGSHTIAVELTLEAGGTSVLHATFSIAP